MKTKVLISTSILTLMTLVVSSCTGISDLFTTPTFTPTTTPTPTNSPTPPPTYTPTPIPTATPTPLPETYTESLGNSATRYVDREGGYRLVFSGTWLVVNLVTDDPTQALQEAMQAHPTGADSLKGFEESVKEGDEFRMVAVDSQNGVKAAIAISQENRSLPLATIMNKSATADKTKCQTINVYPTSCSSRVTLTDVRENPFGVLYGVVKTFMSISISRLEKYSKFYRQTAYFHTDKYAVAITLSANENEGTPNILSIFDEVINSIELLNP